jgi:protein Mpv17
MVARLVAGYNSWYSSRPILTMMFTNALLGGIADTVAQSITAIRLRAVRKPGGIRPDDTLAIEIHDFDKANPFREDDLITDSARLPPPFDFERLARFAGYGFFMAPIQLKWFQFLTRSFPASKASSFGPVLKRVACDQLIFAPVGGFFLVTNSDKCLLGI